MISELPAPGGKVCVPQYSLMNIAVCDVLCFCYVLLVDSVVANMKVKIKWALFLCEENLRKDISEGKKEKKPRTR